MICYGYDQCQCSLCTATNCSNCKLPLQGFGCNRCQVYACARYACGNWAPPKKRYCRECFIIIMKERNEKPE